METWQRSPFRCVFLFYVSCLFVIFAPQMCICADEYRGGHHGAAVPGASRPHRRAGRSRHRQRRHRPEPRQPRRARHRHRHRRPRRQRLADTQKALEIPGHRVVVVDSRSNSSYLGNSSIVLNSPFCASFHECAFMLTSPKGRKAQNLFAFN